MKMNWKMIAAVLGVGGAAGGGWWYMKHKKNVELSQGPLGKLAAGTVVLTGAKGDKAWMLSGGKMDKAGAVAYNGSGLLMSNGVVTPGSNGKYATITPADITKVYSQPGSSPLAAAQQNATGTKAAGDILGVEYVRG